MDQQPSVTASAPSGRSSSIPRRGLFTAGAALTALAATDLAPRGGAAAAHAAATAQTLVDANLFEVSAPIRVTYSCSSITGMPLLSYHDAAGQLDFRGEEITRLQASWGELVTVTIEHVPDAFIRTFTLVVPTIRVAPGADSEFETLGIETTDRSGAFVLAPGPSGVLQTYRVHQLSGTARQVAF